MLPRDRAKRQAARQGSKYRGGPMDTSVPHVAQLLRREAAAWESLLQLQTALATAQSQAVGPHGGPHAGPDTSGHNSPHSRAYLSSLTHLAACGDALVAEALKLRSLRNARDTLESSMYRHVVLQHQEEFFKAGEASSRGLTGNVLQATAELRNEVARARTELTQLRSALEVLNRTSLLLPVSASVVVGLRYAPMAAAAEGSGAASAHRRWSDESDDGDGGGEGDAGREGEGGGAVAASTLPLPPPRSPSLQTVDEFLRCCVAHSGGTAVTDEALVAALLQCPPPDGAQEQNRFPRRKT